MKDHTLDVGEIPLRVLEHGAGPAVVLCHGFPGLAYSWRHQLPALAAAGYRAIAPDMRGYGGSGRPADPAAYDRRSTVADMVGLLDALEIEEAVFVGHDFGAALVWDLPQWAPRRVRALVQLSVPRAAQLPILPSEVFAAVARKHWFHLDYFQRPGVAEAELDVRPREFLQRAFWALSGGYHYTDIYAHPSDGNGYLDVLPEAPDLPWPWLSQAEFEVYVDTFAATGFTGGLNWYRANDHIWHEKQARPDEPVTVPTCFITGDRDPVMQVAGSSIDEMRDLVPGLEQVHMIPGAGHFVQMEAADEVNRIVVDFLGEIDSSQPSGWRRVSPG
ncbi:alpha/beta fold hydrolase [Nocardioides sambongensis]|uniref:alpha/beta fold hydrolase n=1 Tax=Nocardioides sambongensis TaxID=2589074 RepID=UPI00112A6D38|nr:alpha/beta hydrolase [Nocardioides sambongensis]